MLSKINFNRFTGYRESTVTNQFSSKNYIKLISVQCISPKKNEQANKFLTINGFKSGSPRQELKNHLKAWMKLFLVN